MEAVEAAAAEEEAETAEETRSAELEVEVVEVEVVLPVEPEDEESVTSAKPQVRPQNGHARSPGKEHRSSHRRTGSSQRSSKTPMRNTHVVTSLAASRLDLASRESRESNDSVPSATSHSNLIAAGVEPSSYSSGHRQTHSRWGESLAASTLVRDALKKLRFPSLGSGGLGGAAARSRSPSEDGSTTSETSNVNELMRDRLDI